MSFAQSALLSGEVVHKRVHRFRHRLEYRTFSLLLDLDRIEEVERQCRLFSHNRWNVLSLFSSDHADGKHNDLAQYARELVAKELANTQAGKVYLMTYPRVFGYVFNPLSVYLS